MNREIKFRAWNKKEKYMEIVDDLQMFSNDLSIGIPSKDYFLRKDDVELMQYTGLHDKNGKEIYEGDVVYCQTKYGKAKAIIKFIDGKFAAYWNSALTHPENGHHIACYEINKRFEVIGNIYDNPELLGEE